MAPYAFVVVLDAFVFNNEGLREAKEKFDVFLDVSFSRVTVAVCFKVKGGKFLEALFGDVFHDHVRLYSLVVTVVAYSVVV